MNAIQAAPSELQAHTTSMSLFDLDEELENLVDLAIAEEAENGRLSPATEQALQVYFEATVKKVDRIAEFIKHLKIKTEAVKAEKKRLEEWFRAEEAAVDRCKSMVLRFMQTRGLEKIKGKLNSITRQDNSVDSLTVVDQTVVPAEYLGVTLLVPLKWLEENAEELPESVVTVGGVKVNEAAVRGRLSATASSRAIYEKLLGNPELSSQERTDVEAKLRELSVPGCTLARGQHIRIR
jgi:hypothetical protein